MHKRLVIVTWHAIDQFRDRFPAESGGTGYLRLLIAREIEEALLHNRYSTKQPRWARSSGYRSRGRRNQHDVDRTLRFCWIESRERMYLIDKRGGMIKVITAISPEGMQDGD